MAPALAFVEPRRSSRIRRTSIVTRTLPPTSSCKVKKHRSNSTTQRKVLSAAIKFEEYNPETTKESNIKPYKAKPRLTTSFNPDRPTATECHLVHSLLVSAHGPCTQPTTIPPPSLTVAGCGEVPSVLDAVLRTVISGATTMVAANKVLISLVTRYGIAPNGLHIGSVDWDAVSKLSVAELADAIRAGGFANSKATDMLAILSRARQYTADKSLSLEYIRDLDTRAAIDELTSFPRIGFKTAACVVLFCLQRPCFAVDTHVLRMSRSLGWVPEGASAEKTFWHCDERVPGELKYGLHQLFIRHGQSCKACSARGKVQRNGLERHDCVLKGVPTKSHLQ